MPVNNYPHLFHFFRTNVRFCLMFLSSLVPVGRSPSATLRNPLTENAERNIYFFRFLFGVPLSRGKGTKEKRKERHFPSPLTNPFPFVFLLMLPFVTIPNSNTIEIRRGYRSEVGGYGCPYEGTTKRYRPSAVCFLSYYQRAFELISSALHNNALCR